MGPGDSYLVQHSRDAGCFWGDPSKLALGACFRSRQGRPPRQMIDQVGVPSLHAPKLPVCLKRADMPCGCMQRSFDQSVEHGYQASTEWHQGGLLHSTSC